MDVISVVEFGRLGYAEGEALQQRLVRLRQQQRIGDVLLLLEHTPVVTLGRNAQREHLLRSDEQLRGLGVDVAECNRGGDVTFHGPGQLVGYPIVDLRACRRPPWMPVSGSRLHGLGPVDYVRGLEEALIRAAAELGLPCRRIPGLTGVWTQAEPVRKLAAIGVHVSRGVTSHGFAFNVAPDLRGFEYIVPCGIRDRGVTSLQRELGRSPSMAEVRSVVLRQFGSVFARQILRIESADALLKHEAEIAAAAPAAGDFVGRWEPDNKV